MFLMTLHDLMLLLATAIWRQLQLTIQEGICTSLPLPASARPLLSSSVLASSLYPFSHHVPLSPCAWVLFLTVGE